MAGWTDEKGEAGQLKGEEGRQNEGEVDRGKETECK